MNWDYNAAYTHSAERREGQHLGLPGGAWRSRSLRASGALDPFVCPGQQSAAGIDALAAANYKGYWDGGSREARHPVDSRFPRADEDGGRAAACWASAPTTTSEKFQSKPSPFAQGILADPVAGTLCDPVQRCPTPATSASATRRHAAVLGQTASPMGVFGELVIPVMKTSSWAPRCATTTTRTSAARRTAKGTFRWNPMRNLLVRGSIGTGFHAPTVPQVNAAQQSFGVTSDNYTCTPELLQQSRPRSVRSAGPAISQYDQFAGGNPDLKPEKSEQATFGLRFEPSAEYSLGADFWWVGIKDAFGQITEEEVFANPLQYPSSWTHRARHRHRRDLSRLPRQQPEPGQVVLPPASTSTCRAGGVPTLGQMNSQILRDLHDPRAAAAAGGRRRTSRPSATTPSSGP